MRFLFRKDGEHRRWPAYVPLSRIRTSTVVLVVAFIATWWLYEAYKPTPPPAVAPETAVVPPGFVPDPDYTWVPRTNVQERTRTTTTTPTTTTTTTTTTTPSPTETTETAPTSPTSPTSPTTLAPTTVVDPDGPGPLPATTVTPTITATPIVPGPLSATPIVPGPPPTTPVPTT